MGNLKASTAILAALIAAPSHAEPTFAFGLAFSFGGGSGGQAGLSARVLADNAADRLVASGGVTYFFGSGFGADLGVGYNSRHGISAGLGYDFLNNRPVFSLSAADIC